MAAFGIDVHLKRDFSFCQSRRQLKTILYGYCLIGSCMPNKRWRSIRRDIFFSREAADGFFIFRTNTQEVLAKQQAHELPTAPLEGVPLMMRFLFGAAVRLEFDRRIISERNLAAGRAREGFHTGRKHRVGIHISESTLKILLTKIRGTKGYHQRFIHAG